MSGLGNPEGPPFELEVESELDQLLVQAEEVDKNIDRLLTQAGLDVTSVRNPETSAPSNIVEASPEVAQEIRNGSVESNTHRRPSVSAGTIPPLQPSRAADELISAMGRLGTRYIPPRTPTPELTARDKVARENAIVAFLQSLPLLPASDRPEAINTCSICHEAFDNTARPEGPVRLPCHHVFGALCISSWMSLSETCPMCRTVLFAPPIPFALGVNGELGWSTRVLQPVRAPGLPRIAPLMMLHITGGSLEADIRRIDRHVWELAEQNGWLLASQDSLEGSPIIDDILALAQIDVCSRSICCLISTLGYWHHRYVSEIWEEGTS